ncbi:MAG TPA: CpaD family pilus assembly lipoprotein [Azospirillum sp.]|nr:CpaD family pilus assembly lipoprotein [Azospirillum sp.]
MRAPLILSAVLALAGCSANPTERVEWPVTVAPAAGDPQRLVAVPPECGPVPATVHDLHGTSWHNPHLGLGCAQARNFARQVENPRDLLAGRPTGAPDAEREAAAIARYHKGEEKDLMRNGTTATFGAGAGSR